jgi:hypothetical protein
MGEAGQLVNELAREAGGDAAGLWKGGQEAIIVAGAAAEAGALGVEGEARDERRDDVGGRDEGPSGGGLENPEGTGDECGTFWEGVEGKLSMWKDAGEDELEVGGEVVEGRDIWLIVQWGKGEDMTVCWQVSEEVAEGVGDGGRGIEARARRESGEASLGCGAELGFWVDGSVDAVRWEDGMVCRGGKVR